MPTPMTHLSTPMLVRSRSHPPPLAHGGRPPRETGPCVKPGPGLGLRPGQGPDARAPTAGKPSRVFDGT